MAAAGGSWKGGSFVPAARSQTQGAGGDADFNKRLENIANADNYLAGLARIAAQGGARAAQARAQIRDLTPMLQQEVSDFGRRLSFTSEEVLDLARSGAYRS